MSSIQKNAYRLWKVRFSLVMPHGFKALNCYVAKPGVDAVI